MTTEILHLLQKVDPFSRLPYEQLSSISAVCSLLRYDLGQQISDYNVIPNQALLILQGKARLLSLSTGKPKSLGLLGPGSFVGLASLLRGSGCESVSAASEVIGLALPDHVIVQLYSDSLDFAEWCNSNIFPSEAADLTQSILSLSSRSDLDYLDCLKILSEKAIVLKSQPSAAEFDSAVIFVASVNDQNLPIGQVLPFGSNPLTRRGPFPVRFITVPHQLYQQLSNSPSSELPTNTSSFSGADLPEISPAKLVSNIQSSSLPIQTAIDLGHSPVVDNTQLVRGDGLVAEGMACFQMLCSELKIPFRRDAIEKILRDVKRRGTQPNLQLYGGLASMLGLYVCGVLIRPELCTRLQVPAILPWKNSFAILKRSNASGLLLASPLEGWISLSPAEVAELFPDGIPLLQVEKTSATPEQRFGLAWFIPALNKYRSAFLQVLCASFVVQLFSLANPLLIQVIIDKVITQRSLDTLQVLGLALVVVTILESVLGSLRTFLLTETTNRIDTRLGAEVIDHLLRLPLDYFDRRPVGELGSRLSELEKIRSFLTGQGLTTGLDACFSVIYIIVMVAYSWALTLVALAVLPIQVLLLVIGTPLFRRQTRDVSQENARTQSHLVEVLTGIQTVKAQNVEMVSRWKWQELYSAYISRTFEKILTGTALTETSNVLQKLSQLLVLWVGAVLVLRSEMSLGQLIAFRIIAGYVTQPLLRLSSLWQGLQEIRVSLERLADIVDTPEESSENDKKNIPLPGILGRVDFEDVSFQFAPSQPNVLNKVNLSIDPGKFVGIVGQSGSGKSTLMKLLPRLYQPNSGRITIDGYDISKVELYSLRRQIGIVPQDPLLFAGTISENISLTDPDASSDDVLAASRTACAHDFIMETPSGYSTDVGERGAGLSGGQRQRIAIARTLLSRPKLLIMDEATSALDYDTERRVCDNLKSSLVDCTVFFITHRLSTIRNADLIIMMHQGSVSEVGSHDQLMSLQGRYYALYRQQESS